MVKVIKHALKKTEKFFNTKFDYIFDLDVSSPLRKLSDIKNSYIKFKKQNASNLITICKAKKNPYFNMVEIKNNKVHIVKKLKKKYSKFKAAPSSKWSSFYRRQSAPKVFDMNASIYIWRRSRLLNSNKLFSKDTGVYYMPPERSIDIDSLFDLLLVKQIIKYEKRKNL